MALDWVLCQIRRIFPKNTVGVYNFASPSQKPEGERLEDLRTSMARNLANTIDWMQMKKIRDEYNWTVDRNL